MRGNSVDIANENIDISREVDLLSDAVQRFGSVSPEDDAAYRWLVVQGLASGIEKIYSGCERVMQMNAATVDGERVGAADGWHLALLKRMSHEYPGVRGAVLSRECVEGMDLLRSFRHRERNSYGLALDGGIVIERARQTKRIFDAFRREVLTFTSSP
jgi:hypothetical protein